MLNEFYNMDCMIGMNKVPDKYFDLAFVDPQYGLNAPQMSMGTNKTRKFNGYPSISTAEKLRKDRKNNEWDTKPPTSDYFTQLFRVSKNQIIWGGNYFNLPPARCIICWTQNRDVGHCQ